MDKILFQTTEDRGNPDHVLSYGPFKCTRKDVWICEGYYFWDSYIRFAHKWGKSNYAKTGYIITKYVLDFNSDIVFDLTNATYMSQFMRVCEILTKERNRKLYVPEIIEFMRRRKIIPVTCIGVIVNSNGFRKGNSSDYILFNDKYKAQLNLYPEVQVCLFSKESIKKGSAEIVYPTKYI